MINLNLSIKEQIINRVNSINNPVILNEILKLISAESEIDKIYRLPQAERKNVNEGIENADNGNVLIQEDSEKLISKWLKEKLNGQSQTT